MATKPDMTIAWSQSGTNVKPADSKIDAGWIAEKPPFQTYNWWQNRADHFLQHVNVEGIPIWDLLTTYAIGSISKGSDGVLYKSLTANINIDPVADAGANWIQTTFIEGGIINDENDNIILELTPVLLAVNQLEVRNSVLGSPIILSSKGQDADIDVQVSPKGSGYSRITGGPAGVVQGAYANLDTPEVIAFSSLVNNVWTTVSNTTLLNAGAKIAVLRLLVNNSRPSAVDLSVDFSVRKVGSGDGISDTRAVSVQATRDSPGTVTLKDASDFPVSLDSNYDFEYYLTVSGGSVTGVDLKLIGYYT